MASFPHPLKKIVRERELTANKCSTKGNLKIIRRKKERGSR